MAGEIQVAAPVTNAGTEWAEVQTEIIEVMSGQVVAQESVPLGPGTSTVVEATLFPLEDREYRFAVNVMPSGDVEDTDWSNNSADEAISIGPVVTGVSPDEPIGENPAGIPNRPVLLRGVYPNPFNPRVTVDWAIASDGQVNLTVYDVRGRLVRELYTGPGTAGTHRLVWDGKDDSGQDVATGVFFIRATSGGAQDARKIVLVK